ncbi:MAG: hypothetical protein JWR54_247 [Mucilaginibacter sp.]|nr:hypothetical protein [Mucilaginibacter sp.]
MTHEQSNLMNMKEEETLAIAIDKLAALTGATIKNPGANTGKDLGADGLIEIQLNNKLEIFEVEIKNELRANRLPVSLMYHQDEKMPQLLISNYIPMPLKQELKRRKINYLEAAGNCFIQTPQLFIYINDQQVTDIRIPSEGKLWKVAGLKFLFVILRLPELLNTSYRDIAEEAGIALGSIGGMLEELTNEGYLKEGTKNGRKIAFIENRNRLLERWAEAYRANLRPKQLIGNFRFLDKNDAKNWEGLGKPNFKWGGENAAAILTKYIQPEKYTIYTTENRVKLMHQLKLVPDPAGQVELLQQFWPDDEHQENEDLKATVPPLLVYADLITNFDSRNREAAERIKKSYLD